MCCGCFVDVLWMCYGIWGAQLHCVHTLSVVCTVVTAARGEMPSQTSYSMYACTFSSQGPDQPSSSCLTACVFVCDVRFGFFPFFLL